MSKEDYIHEKLLEYKLFLELAGNDPGEVLIKLNEIKKILKDEGLLKGE